MRDRQREPQERAAARRRLGAHGPAVPLGDVAHDRQAEAGAGAPACRGRRGRSGRRRAGGRSGAIPGPWSRTVSSPSRSATSTVAARRAPLRRVVEQVGDRAVEPRRARRSTTHGSSSVVERHRGRVPLRRARRRPPTSSSSRSGSSGSPVGSPSRASSTRSPTSSPSSSSCATRSRAQALAVGRRAARRGEPSTSRLVRSDVSGVRSSCEASATSWRCARCESSSASSIVLNDAASRASSSSPSASIRRERSRVRATCSAVSVRSVTGRTAWRVARRARKAASAMPATASRGRARAAASTSASSTSVSGRATCIAVPVAGLRAVKDAHVRAVDVVVGEERAAPAVGDRLHLVGIAEPVRRCPARGDHAVARRRAARTRPGRSSGSIGGSAPGRQLDAEPLADRPAARSQRRVDLAAQRVAHDDVGDDRAEHDGDRDRDGGGERRCGGAGSWLAQDVADAAHRLDQPRLAVRLELAAQVADVDLERVRAGPKS